MSRRLSRCSLLSVLMLGACAIPSLVRNWTVSGKPYVYTAAGGINAYLGNNAVARSHRAMLAPADEFAFEPINMHQEPYRASSVSGTLSNVLGVGCVHHAWFRKFPELFTSNTNHV